MKRRYSKYSNRQSLQKRLNMLLQETQLSLTNRTTRLEISQGHQTTNMVLFRMIGMVSY